MATGRQAFAGVTAGTTHDAILNRTPVDPTLLNPVLPPRLQDILTRALEKDRALRYQNAADLRADLQRLTRDLELGRRPALAVAARPPRGGATDGCSRRSGSRSWRLRLARCGCLVARAWPGNRLGRRAAVRQRRWRRRLRYFSDGITESLIRDLSQVQSLKVTAREPRVSLPGQGCGSPAIGRELSVRAVLSGRLLQRGDMVVVRTELMDVSDGSQLWGGESTRTRQPASSSSRATCHARSPRSCGSASRPASDNA